MILTFQEPDDPGVEPEYRRRGSDRAGARRHQLHRHDESSHNPR